MKQRDNFRSCQTNLENIQGVSIVTSFYPCISYPYKEKLGVDFYGYISVNIQSGIWLLFHPSIPYKGNIIIQGVPSINAVISSSNLLQRYPKGWILGHLFLYPLWRRRVESGHRGWSKSLGNITVSLPSSGVDSKGWLLGTVKNSC